jgi:pimeloyl-ACP methyl ester carboxylesterase
MMKSRDLPIMILLTILCCFSNPAVVMADNAHVAGQWILEIDYPSPFTAHGKGTMCNCHGECVEVERESEGQLPPKDGVLITQEANGNISGEYSHNTTYGSVALKITGKVTGDEVTFTRLFTLESQIQYSFVTIKDTLTIDETYTGTVNGNITGDMKGSYHSEQETINNYDPDCPITTYITVDRQYDVPFTVNLPIPVILLHGIWDDANTCWKKSGVTKALDREGIPWFAPSFCPNNGSIANEAAVVANIITENSGTGNLFDIVAHSMGGLAARFYLAHDELWPKDENGTPEHRVRKLITLGTPHLGTDIHLLHPAAANINEFHNMECKMECKHIYYDDPFYNFMIWSPGLQEMTARWKPPGLWGSKEVMPAGERWKACTLKRPEGEAPNEWNELCERFPPPDLLEPGNNKKSYRNHVEYYKEMIQELTDNKKYSPFLKNLNSRAIPTDVQYYLIRGTNRSISYNFLCVIETPLFLKADYGDGSVPPDSAWGVGLNFPHVVRWEINATHIQLPKAAKAKILEYLEAVTAEDNHKGQSHWLR